jgi:hypothetical protein
MVVAMIVTSFVVDDGNGRDQGLSDCIRPFGLKPENGGGAKTGRYPSSRRHRKDASLALIKTNIGIYSYFVK